MTTNTINVTINTVASTELSASERAFNEICMERLRKRTFKKFKKSSSAEGVSNTIAELIRRGII